MILAICSAAKDRVHGSNHFVAGSVPGFHEVKQSIFYHVECLH